MFQQSAIESPLALVPLLALVQTSRLILRAIVAQDLSAAIDIHCDPQTNRFNPTPYKPEQMPEMLERWLADWRDERIGYWAVCACDAQERVIGFGGLRRKIIDNQPSLNLCFRFSPVAWGKGYATEMGKPALNAAFNVQCEKNVHAVVQPVNLPSVKTLEKLGLKCLREWAEDSSELPHLLYGITADAFLRA